MESIMVFMYLTNMIYFMLIVLSFIISFNTSAKEQQGYLGYDPFFKRGDFLIM